MSLKTLIPSKFPPGVIKRNHKNVGMAVFPPGLWSGIHPLTVASVLQREAETTPCLGPFWDELLHGELLPPFEQSLARVYAESWPGTVPALRKLLMETKDFPACCVLSKKKFLLFLHLGAQLFKSFSMNGRKRSNTEQSVPGTGVFRPGFEEENEEFLQKFTASFFQA